MKTIKLDLKTRRGEPRTVEARDFYPFAVHVSLHDVGSASHAREWTVTHVPCGLACGTSWKFAEAVAIAKKLASDRFWLTTDPTKWNADTTAQAKAKRDAALADLGLVWRS